MSYNQLMGAPTVLDLFVIAKTLSKLHPHSIKRTHWTCFSRFWDLKPPKYQQNGLQSAAGDPKALDLFVNAKTVSNLHPQPLKGTS